MMRWWYLRSMPCDSITSPYDVQRQCCRSRRPSILDKNRSYTKKERRELWAARSKAGGGVVLCEAEGCGQVIPTSALALLAAL